MAESRLIVFAKAPVPGQVKTRLVPPLTEEQAAAVHEASLMDVVRQGLTMRVDVSIRHDDAPGSSVFFARTFPDLERRAQGSGNLGRRLERTFDAEFAGDAERVAIIGSDSPTLPSSALTHAFAALDRQDVVLGPALDGGYYLIGLRRRGWPEARVLLSDVPWSSERVLRATLDRLEGTGLSAELLTPWYDIDRIEDLRLAASHAQPDSRLGRLLGDELATWLVSASTRHDWTLNALRR